MLRHTIFGKWCGRKMETTFGMQIRNDWIHNGLFRTEDRVRTSKTYYTANYSDNGWSSLDQVAVLPAATDLNQVYGDDRESLDVKQDPVGEQIPFGPRPARRLWQRHRHQLDEPHHPELSQRSLTRRLTIPILINRSAKFLPSPKASLIVGPWNNTEFYLQGGFSYHTNDVRGSTQQYEPVSPDYPYYNTPNPIKIPFLVQTKGGEVGVRTEAVPHLQSTAEIWYLHSNSELLQDGDTRRHECLG